MRFIMKWFAKHLNWTTAGMALGSIGLFFLFIWLSFGFNYPYWPDIVALGTPTLILLALLVISWLFLNALGFGWILYRKKRSFMFLSLLLPELLAVMGGIVYKIFWFSSIYLGNYADYIHFEIINYQELYTTYIAFLLILWFIISLIILISLKNKRVNSLDNQIIANKATLKFKRTLMLISGMNLVFLIVCSLFINLGYLTYHHPNSKNTELPKVSFEYPASSDEPILNHIKVFHSGYPHSDDFEYNDYISMFNINGSYGSINGLIPKNGAKLSEYDLDDYSNSILQQYENPPEYQQIIKSEVMVGKIPARQLAISVKHELIYEIDWNDFGNHFYVIFKDRGKIFVISYHSGHRSTPTTTPPADFTHLLETFKILD